MLPTKRRLLSRVIYAIAGAAMSVTIWGTNASVAQDTNYVSVAYVEAGQGPRISIRIVDRTGWAISPTAKGAQPIRTVLVRDGKAIDVDAARENGSYTLRIGHHPNAWAVAIGLQEGKAARVTIRPATLQIERRDAATASKTTRLILSAAKEIAADTFARKGCKIVTPNIATIVALGPRDTNATVYLPPGRYRVIPQVGDRFESGFFVRLRAGGKFAIAVRSDGIEPEARTAPPIYNEKCYY